MTTTLFADMFFTKKAHTSFSTDLNEFQIAAEYSPVHIIFTNPDGVILYANKAAEKLTGYSKKEMIGKTPAIWGKQMSKSYYANFWKTIKKDLKVYHGNIQNKHKSGHFYDAEIWVSPVLDSEQKLKGFVGIEADRTKEKKLLNNIIEKEVYLNEITSNISEVFFLLDIKSLKIEFASKNFEEMWGDSIKSFNKNQKAWDKFISKKEQIRITRSIKQVSESNDPVEIQFKTKTRKYIHLRLFPVLNEEGSVYRISGITRDTTDSYNSQKQIEELQLLKDKFIQTVSHQFRTPLTSIKWNLELMLDDSIGPINEAQKGFTKVTLNMANELVERLSLLLTALELSQGQTSIELTSFVLIDNLVTSLVGKHKDTCKKRGLNCHFLLPKQSLKLVKGDPKKLRLAVDQLIQNAIDFTPEGTIKVSLFTSNDQIRFEVTDSGIGIPKEEADRIFHRFYRASNAITVKPDGAGVGLYISKKIIEAHGGEIGFTSNENKGTTFWFVLPIHLDE